MVVVVEEGFKPWEEEEWCLGSSVGQSSLGK